MKIKNYCRMNALILIFSIATILCTKCSYDTCKNQFFDIGVSPNYYICGNGDTVNFEIEINCSGKIKKLEIIIDNIIDTIISMDHVNTNSTIVAWNYVLPEIGISDGDSIKINFIAFQTDYKQKCFAEKVNTIAKIECLNPPAKKL